MTPEPAREKTLNRPRFKAGDLEASPKDRPVAPRGLFAWYAPGFSDRLGDRLRLFDNTEGPPLELLRLRAEFSRAPDFEFSLRARVGELRDFEHPRFAHVCRADRLPEPGGGLALVSVRADGVRLSEVLALARERGARLAADLALPLTSQLAGAISALHALGRHIVHGAIDADRLVVGPGGRLLVTDYVLGSALGGLALSRDGYWRELGIALPADPTLAPFDQRTDAMQIGMVALSLALSRPLTISDHPARIRELLEEAGQRSIGAGWNERWPPFLAWLRRALQTAPGSFADADEAAAALAASVPGTGPRDDDRAWDRFVADCEAPAALNAAAAHWSRALPEATENTGSPAVLSRSSLDERENRVKPDDSSRPAGVEVRVGETGADGSSAAPAVLPGLAENAGVSEGRMDTDGPGTNGWWRPFVRPASTRVWRPGLLALLALSALLALGEGIYIAARFLPSEETAAAEMGSVHVVSHPPGAIVLVNGVAAGRTPATLELRPGSHSLELASGTRRRIVPITVTAGARLSHVVELPGEVVATGDLRVTTQPSGLRVTVDGEPRGASPLMVAGLGPGTHTVRVEGQGRSATQAVEVEAGRTASLVVPLPGASAPAPGWLSIPAEVELQVFENGELLGTSRSPRIMIAAGRHELDLVNEELGIRLSEEVHVPVGRTETLEVQLPRGRVDLNALPWAEVWIDGERVGETPLAGIPVLVGRHVVTFRHPDLGERKVECVVALNKPARVGVDLRR